MATRRSTAADELPPYDHAPARMRRAGLAARRAGACLLPISTAADTLPPDDDDLVIHDVGQALVSCLPVNGHRAVNGGRYAAARRSGEEWLLGVQS
jgi:hypothetical protein